MASFSTADYVIFFLTIAISIAIGVVFAVRDRLKTTTDEYFFGGRKFKVLPAALSFAVTYQSSLLMLGVPIEVYLYGTIPAYGAISAVLGYGLAALILVPVFHPLEVTSIYQYFQLRYNSHVVRYMMVCGVVIFVIVYMGTLTFGTCVALQTVVGLPYWSTMLIYVCMTTIYTSVGGIKGVIWTDVFQFLVMVAGILALHIQIAITVGGPGELFHEAASRIARNEFKFDPTTRYTFWNTTIGFTVAFFNLSCSQAGMQRMKSTPSVNSGRLLFILAGPAYAVVLLLANFLGVSIFAYYSNRGCDPIASGKLKNVNGLVPFAMLDVFETRPGLGGLFVAALSSAVLSTLSSCLNSLSAITHGELLKVKFPNMSEKKATQVSKAVVLVYGIAVIVMTFCISRLPGSLVAITMSFFGCMEGSFVGVFLLSLLFRRATVKGVVTGALAGFSLTLWINLGNRFSDMPKEPILALGPTDHCSAILDHSNITSLVSLTVPTNTSTPSFKTYLNYNTTAATDFHEETTLSPLQKFYSLSLILYGTVGMTTTLLVGIVVSLLTKPPTQIDERCLFSFTKHVLGKHNDSQLDKVVKEENVPMVDTGTTSRDV